MAVALSQTASTSSATDDTNYNFAAQSFGTAVAGRIVAVAIGWRSTSPRTITAFTIGGITASVVVAQTNTNNDAAIYAAVVPNGTSGAIDITFNGTVARIGCVTFRVAGADPTATDTLGVAANDPSGGIDVPANGGAIALAYAAASTTATWTGLTESVDTTVEGNTFTTANDQFVSAQVGLTVTANFGSSSQDVLVAAAWGPAKSITADAGSYTLTGTAATFRKTWKVVAASGSYALTGTAATPKLGRKVVAAAGSYLLTGSNVNLNKGKRISVDPGSYSFTGTAATLRQARKVTAVAGSYVLTGATVALKHGWKVTAASGSYSIVGASVNFLIAKAPSIHLPVFGGWTVKIKLETPTLRVTDESLQPAVVSPSSSFATAPLRVMTSTSTRLRVRA